MTKNRGIYEMHGGRETRAYSIWCGIRARCNNPTAKAYPNYGGRGITVCDRWSKFSLFFHDMGEPAAGMTLERRDNDKGYSPENCIWAGRVVQGRNKRNNHLLTIDGDTLPISVWAERSGIKYGTIHRRVIQGWAPKAAVFTPLVTQRKGIPRGAKIHAFGAQHGVMFAKDDAEAA